MDRIKKAGAIGYISTHGSLFDSEEMIPELRTRNAFKKPGDDSSLPGVVIHILDAQKLLARTEGIGVEPASAASIAGLRKLVDQGVIDKGETITCVVTGHLLKDPNTAIDACTKPTEVDADIDTLRKMLMNE